jgi:hypothetical protein
MVRKLIKILRQSSATIFISLILLFTIPVGAANWYVNFNNTSGTYNGESWATAWRTLDKFWSKIDGTIYGVDWDLINDGDTIFVSGGTDSTTMIAQTINASGYVNTMSFNPPVIICPSKESGHNGDIYIRNTIHTKIALAISGFSGLKISGFNVYHIPNNVFSAQQCAYISTGERINIDSCHFVSDGSSSVLTFADVSYSSLTKSTLETLTNYFPANQDILGLTAGGTPIPGANTIDGNTMIGRAQYAGITGTANGAVTVTGTSLTDTRLNMVTDYHKGARVTCGGQILDVTSNTATTFNGTAGWFNSTPSDGQAWDCETAAHFDMIQIGGASAPGSYGSNKAYTTTFSNNFLWSYSVDYPMSNVIYSNGSHYQRFLMYNNIVSVMSPTPVSPCAFTDNEADQYNNVFVYNNTFNVPDGSIIYVRPVDTVVVKNNIMLATNTIPVQPLVIGYNQTAFDTCYKDVDYNYYYTSLEYIDDIEIFASASSAGTSRFTWAEWIVKWDDSPSDLFINTDQNSDTGYIALADVRDSVISAFMPPSDLIGTDLSGLGIFNTDILGNPRTIWSLGAVEFLGQFKIMGGTVSKVQGIVPSKIYGIQ